MPTTRSRAAKGKRAMSFDSEVERREEEVDVSSSSEQDSISMSTASIQKHLEHALVGFDKIKGQLQALQKENKRLKVELASSRKSLPQIKRTMSPVVARSSEDDMNLENMQLQKLQDQVRNLEGRVEKLTNENQRQQKRIKKFERKELQEEVKGLKQKPAQDSDGGEEMDSEYRMRKLLRKFSDLMLVTTIEDDNKQQCNICYDPLETNQCSALQCEHIICHDCLPKMSRGSDETVMCAECRRVTPRENIELIHMTEVQRWDCLLDVAKAWAAFDVRGEEETSEEEAEENFINDETGTSDLSLDAGQDESIDEDRVASEEAGSSVNDRSSTPPPNSKSFFDSPTKEKRKRMEQLAEERTNKRRK